VSHQDVQDRGGEDPPVVVRDRRRIDPTTGAVRTPPANGDDAGTPPASSSGAATATARAPSADGDLQAQLDERTADLQRITAEYANYRKRVDRDREAVVTMAKAAVVADLLGVLDDLERAEAHGDLTGPFRAVADKVTMTLQKVGLTAYGHEGEPFDPMLHEAVQHATSPDVAGPTVTAVLRRGYKFGERLLRPAMVAVTDHEPGPVPTVDEDALLEPEPPGALARSDGDNAGGGTDDTASTH
jgi:molecular chaperone GrpE